MNTTCVLKDTSSLCMCMFQQHVSLTEDVMLMNMNRFYLES